VPGAADPLQRAGDRLRRLELHDAVHSADVDAELERARRDDGAELAALELSLDLLPPLQRLAVTLKYVEGLATPEIAAAMEAPVNTVKTWLLRARERLRQELADEL